MTGDSHHRGWPSTPVTLAYVYFVRTGKAYVLWEQACSACHCGGFLAR